MSGIRNLGYMLRDIKKRRIAAAVTVLVSLLAVFVVYSVLNRPGVAMTTADCISYDAEGYPVVTIPEDAEVVATGQNTSTSYNYKYTVYDADDGYILYIEPYDPAKTYTFNGSSLLSTYRSQIKAVKAAPGLTSIREFGSSYSYTSLVTADFSECPELATIGDHTFSGCSNLESINFAQDCAITKLGSRYFYDCKSLKSFPFERLTKLKTISGSSD